MSWTIMDNLVGLILRERKGCVVEIGVCSLGSGSTKILLKHAEAADVNFYTCDKHEKKNLQPTYEKHKHFLGKSFDFMEVFDDVPAVVFLDGCPEYDVAMTEVRFFLERLMDGGVIFVHNTHPSEERFLDRSRCADCYRVRQEMEREKDVDCFTWPYESIEYNAGLTMILKKPKNRPYYQE